MSIMINLQRGTVLAYNCIIYNVVEIFVHNF